MNCWPPIVRKAWLHQNRRMRCSDRTIFVHEMQKKDEEKEKEEEHQKLASRMIASAEGGTSLLRKITKPTARRAECKFCTKKKNVKPSARCEEKRKELAKHWHSDTEVQVKKKTSHGEAGSCKVWRQECQV